MFPALIVPLTLRIIANKLNTVHLYVFLNYLFISSISEIRMAPKDLSYNVPDILSGNEIAIQEDEIEIQYPDPGLSPEEFNQEIDELISLQLNFTGK